MDDFGKNLFTARERLLNEISSLNDGEFNRTFEISKWSIGQICHHLLKTETLSRKAILFGLDQRILSETDRKSIQIVLDRSVKYQAPAIAEPGSGPFQVPQIIQRLSDSRNKLIDVLDKVDDKSILKEIAVNHPRFGDLPLDQWIELLYLHEQRHIEQIKDLKALL
ncbi:DinB family protein [Paenibacillus sp. J2TS4]|uniref:DinB family protein n=1 Tax=Paenibacillus sp. J2TS4 TaxID=2807194 RepID=UPI001B2BE10E|nr:DinB family protein [Paenibacillus sp. J2TS4]GIP33531.1 PadR family transcriptional regulator [Paenibacillus sp. J2TS4]